MIGRRAALLAAVLLAGACAGTSTLDGARLEQNIRADAGMTDAQLGSVDCPRDRTVHENDRFQCTAALTSGETLRYDVQIVSAAGDYTYKLAPDQTIDGAAVAAELTADIAGSSRAFADAAVTCPPTILAPGGGAAFGCQVSTGGQTAALRVTKQAGQPAVWSFET